MVAFASVLDRALNALMMEKAGSSWTLIRKQGTILQDQGRVSKDEEANVSSSYVSESLLTRSYSREYYERNNYLISQVRLGPLYSPIPDPSGSISTSIASSTALCPMLSSRNTMMVPRPTSPAPFLKNARSPRPLRTPTAAPPLAGNASNARRRTYSTPPTPSQPPSSPRVVTRTPPRPHTGRAILRRISTMTRQSTANRASCALQLR